jgi:hypothetical protein
MTNINHNPQNDFPIGYSGVNDAEDTEGHIKRGYVGEAEEAERHLEDADTEGHIRLG